MRKVSLVVGSPYTENNIFDIHNKALNRDNCLYHYYLLREEFKKHDIDISTSDINIPGYSEFVIYCDMPSVLPKAEQIEKSYLIINESELIKPRNWDIENHKYFRKIFTWNDSYVDNKKYFKLNTFPVVWDGNFLQDVPKEKLCTMIAGNKHVDAPNELYSERVNAIRWFENNHPGDFDLYGMGWDVHTFSGPITHCLNRLQFLRTRFAVSYPSYKGRVTEKKAVLSKYRFAICYENAAGIPGYITEKIFDCFVSGCVPIYLGAPNIADFVPKSCFIDKQQYSTYPDLYNYLQSITDGQYQIYMNNIVSFLKSEKMELFSPEHYAQTIVSLLASDISCL